MGRYCEKEMEKESETQKMTEKREEGREILRKMRKKARLRKTIEMGSKKVHEEERRKRQKIELEGRKKKEESKKFSIIWLLVPENLTLDLTLQLLITAVVNLLSTDPYHTQYPTVGAFLRRVRECLEKHICSLNLCSVLTLQVGQAHCVWCLLTSQGLVSSDVKRKG